MTRPDIALLRKADPKALLAARRGYEGPALFSYGFRPFFLFGALWGALIVPLWMHAYMSGAGAVGGTPALAWHIHEMLFGFLGAIVAGFLLTAVPNWTGSLPVLGPRLMALFALWVAGRAAMFAYETLGPAAAVIDSAFLLALVATLGREVLAGGNKKNLPVVGLVSVFALANVGFHVSLHFGWDLTAAQSVAAAVIAMLVALIGGRITPSFTRNWMAQRGETDLPASPARFDAVCLGATAVALIAWVLAPLDWFSGALLLIAGGLQTLRLARWKGWRTLAEPLVTILHLGYAWVPVALILMGLAAIAPGLVPMSAALHALTAGAMATMSLAVMTRASLGHTGRERTADVWTCIIFAAVILGALLRVAGPLFPAAAMPAMSASAGLWFIAFALFFVRYLPVLIGPRR